MSRVIQRYNLTTFEAEYRAYERRAAIRRGAIGLFFGLSSLFFLVDILLG